MEVREVWQFNFAEELELMTTELRGRYRYIAVDTEFPGFLRSTPQYASEEERYGDLKFNVDRMKLIQLGVALFDKEGNMPLPGYCWEFNFSDFDPAKNVHSEPSIELLKRSGMDFDKMQRHGVETGHFSVLLQELLSCCHGIRWITFHGLYDIAYLVKLLTGGTPLPETLPQFLFLARNLLGRCYDIKFIARYCDGLLSGEIGLIKMSKMVGMELVGAGHQAGYDSLLTGLLFWEIKKMFEIDEDVFVGVLYGVEIHCMEGNKRSRTTMVRPNFLLSDAVVRPFNTRCGHHFPVAPPFGRMIYVVAPCKNCMYFTFCW